MELVYLWVGNYKNIHHQGFNFSPRFHCAYNDEKKELTINENDDYIPDFFGENINVTAIVGKNGSGKSSLLESFGFLWGKIYYIYYKKGQLYSNYFNKDVNGKNIEVVSTGIDTIYMNKLFFMEKYRDDFFNLNSLYKENLYVRKFKDSEYNKFSSEKFHKNILQLILLQKIYLPFKFFNPKKISINFNMINKNLKVKKTLESIKKNEITHNYKIFYKIYLKSLEIFHTNQGKQLNEYKLAELEDKNENSIKNFIKQTEDEILEYDYMEDEEIKLRFNDEEFFIFLKKNFHIRNKKIEINNFDTNYLKDENNDYSDIFYYLYQIGFLEYEIYDEDSKVFSSLSSGEKSLFSDFCILSEKLNKDLRDSNNKSIDRIIFLDEPDLTLHPEWQRQYITYLLSILKKYKDINFHLIFTTHSPFLLSDIPKQNIIFLDTYKKDEEDKQKEGNCKVVDGLKQTFGANIHTLLTDSFFMEGGLMGEFAKQKINKIIRFLNGKNKFIDFPINQIEKVIKSIGEPFLKQKLLDMYNKKFIKEYKDRQKEKIKKQIEDLNSQLKELDNDSNK